MVLYVITPVAFVLYLCITGRGIWSNPREYTKHRACSAHGSSCLETYRLAHLVQLRGTRDLVSGLDNNQGSAPEKLAPNAPQAKQKQKTMNGWRYWRQECIWL